MSYFKYLSEVIDAVYTKAFQENCKVEEDGFFPPIEHVSYETTFRTHLSVTDSKGKKRTIAVQIYRMNTGTYELNQCFTN